MDKKYNKQAIKGMLYGTINEITNNRTFYWRGINDQFSHLTEEGQAQLAIAIERIIPLIHHAEDEEIEEKSRDITLSILKDDKK